MAETSPSLTEKVLLVSANLAYRPGMSTHDLERHIAGGYALPVTKMQHVHRVVAVIRCDEGWTPVAAWRLRGHYATDRKDRGGKTLHDLSLGESLVIEPELWAATEGVSLRRGVGVAVVDGLDWLPDEIRPDEDRDVYGLDDEE